MVYLIYAKFGDNAVAVAQRVERWTWINRSWVQILLAAKSCVTTLGKLFTSMCICHQAV